MANFFNKGLISENEVFGSLSLLRLLVLYSFSRTCVDIKDHAQFY